MSDTSRQRILDAALQLLARRGFEGMSLQMLADAVGLHKATLFHHFADKSDLALEVFDSVVRRLLQRLEPLDAADAPSVEQLIHVAEELVDHFADDPAAARFLMRDMVAAPGSPFAVDERDTTHPVVRSFTILWRWLERAQRARVIRKVDVPHTILNLLGVILFYPAAAPDLSGVAGRDPFSPLARRERKQELAAFLRGALAPR